MPEAPTHSQSTPLASPAAAAERDTPIAWKPVVAWGMYDLANQSFQLVINTLLFGVYLQKVVAPSEDAGKILWSRIVAAGLIVVVVLSPIVGAVVDARAWKREFLLISGVLAAALTGLLSLVGVGGMWIAAAIYIPAAILVGLGENVLASFLPQLATPKTMGKVSAIGWTMSYIGAIVLQLIVLGAALGLGMKAASDWRPLFVMSGVWFALGIIPAFLFLKESTPPTGERHPIRAGIRRLGDTIRDAQRYRQLLRFLLVFLVYSFGTQIVVYFAGSIAVDMKFTSEELFKLVLLLSVTAGIAAFALAFVQDRLGGVRTVAIVLVVWIATALGLAAMCHWNAGKSALWALSVGVGLGFGGIGSASRAVVGSFTPESKSAEFFGLWGMVYKLAGVIGPMSFAWAQVKLGLTPALLIIAGFFAAGLVMLLVLVDEREGRASAAP